VEPFKPKLRKRVVTGLARTLGGICRTLFNHE
jgi:hypothetical protein